MEPKIYILKNKALEVHISDLGATLTRMITKDKTGKEVDVLLGMEHAADYATPAYQASGAYLGAVIGRYGNRIAGGKFEIDGQEYQLAINNGKNHLHGGLCGFDKKRWARTVGSDQSLTLSYVSEDGEENYPGTVTVDIRFTLKNRELHIEYKAVTDRKCYLNLTHHPYFNLNPEALDIKDQELKVFTDCYLHTNNLIPDGRYVTAENEYNFITPQSLKKIIENCGGLDDCYIFQSKGEIIRMAELYCPENGLKLYVSSNYPGLQVYTGRFLEVRNAKGGKHYGAFAGLALEAQYWPDSPHHPDFPSTLLNPREEYKKTTIYGFE